LIALLGVLILLVLLVIDLRDVAARPLAGGERRAEQGEVLGAPDGVAPDGDVAALHDRCPRRHPAAWNNLYEWNRQPIVIYRGR
jgi:hypothetical protein